MQIEMMEIELIHPYENNPRKNDAAVDAVAASIKKFGFRQPIVCDAQKVIVVGHTRWKAAKKLGLSQVPVHIADLSEVDAKSYRIADNRLQDIAEWDQELLPLELSELKKLDVSLESLGFSEKELESFGLIEDAANISPGQENLIEHKYQILISFPSEPEQAQALEKFIAEGYECRSLIS